MRGFDMRRLHQVDRPRVGDDQLGALPQPTLHLRSEDRMRVRRVGADDEHNVRFFDAVEILRARRGAKRLLQPVTGGRMAYARAGVDVVIAESGARQFDDGPDLFDRAAGR